MINSLNNQLALLYFLEKKFVENEIREEWNLRSLADRNCDCGKRSRWSVKSHFSWSIIDNLIARYATKLINSSLLIAYGHTPMPEGSKIRRYRWRDRRGGEHPGRTYNRIVHGSRGPAASPRSRISTKAERRNCEVVIRHPSFAVKRLPTTTTMTMTTTTTTTVRYRKRTCGDTIAYIRTLLSSTLWQTTPPLRIQQDDTTFARVGVIAFSLTMLTEERYYVTTVRLLCYRWLIVWENYYIRV